MQGLNPLSPPIGVVCCSMLQCIAAYCSFLQCVAVFCGVLQCVAVSCSGCVYIGLLGSSFQGFAVDASQMCCNVLQCVAMCCSVLLSELFRSHLSNVSKCAAVCCNVLQCVALP